MLIDKIQLKLFMPYDMKSLNARLTDDSSFSNDFISLSQDIATYAEKCGVKVTPFRDLTLPHFSPLPNKEKQAILDFLKGKLSWLQSVELTGASFDSNKHILWHAIKSFGLVPSSDLMEKIDDNCVIEIHWLETLVQAFHTFSFYKNSSYTLEEICSYPWQELYEVDKFTSEGIFNLAQTILKGDIKSTVCPGFPPYVVKETKSCNKYEVEIHYLYVSPLFDKTGKPVAAVSIESMQVLNKKTERTSAIPEVRPQTATV